MKTRKEIKKKVKAIRSDRIRNAAKSASVNSLMSALEFLWDSIESYDGTTFPVDEVVRRFSEIDRKAIGILLISLLGGRK